MLFRCGTTNADITSARKSSLVKLRRQDVTVASIRVDIDRVKLEQRAEGSTWTFRRAEERRMEEIAK